MQRTTHNTDHVSELIDDCSERAKPTLMKVIVSINSFHVVDENLPTVHLFLVVVVSSCRQISLLIRQDKCGICTKLLRNVGVTFMRG